MAKKKKLTEEDNYSSLIGIMLEALDQASKGKGLERHANEEIPFENQTICILRRSKLSFTSGQAVKKIIEARRLEDLKGKEAAIHELLGAINYIAAEVIILKEEEKKNGKCEIS